MVKIGEAKVSAHLSPLFFDRIEHRLLNNVILVDDLGKSHQIDHIEIRKNGIFCIETKNYTGWIFGDENSYKWTQCIYHNKHNFLNPLKQNKSHIYQISRVLGGKYKINSLIVMVQNNADKIKCSNVINLNYLKRYLYNFDNGIRYSVDEINQIYNKLQAARVFITNRDHVKTIRKTQQELRHGICPRCGSELVERKGKYGNFIGCSNYPKCKFILK